MNPKSQERHSQKFFAESAVRHRILISIHNHPVETDLEAPLRAALRSRKIKMIRFSPR
jgi:hypothetical protein